MTTVRPGASSSTLCRLWPFFVVLGSVELDDPQGRPWVSGATLQTLCCDAQIMVRHKLAIGTAARATCLLALLPAFEADGIAGHRCCRTVVPSQPLVGCGNQDKGSVNSPLALQPPLQGSCDVADVYSSAATSDGVRAEQVAVLRG